MNTGIARSMEIASDSSNTPREDYDKLETVVITLNEDGLQSENELIRYLSLLLNKEMPVEQREKELEKDHHLQMTEDLREDVGKMCNYSEAIWMQGIEKGIAQGETNGSIKTAAGFVRKKLISIKDAAEQLGVTEKDFCEKAGIQIFRDGFGSESEKAKNIFSGIKSLLFGGGGRER